ncbi:MAG TPA: DNA-binding protein [Lachnospiraceae bacterium]|nr:DNA-binding protein [Lachnospiraceae bacterium]
MIVISDTTPIISLIKIERLELLNQLFGEIQIPNAVYAELTSNVRFKGEAEFVSKAEYIKKVIVEDVKSVELLRRATGLDAGEKNG